MHCRNRLWHTSFLVLLLSMFAFASCVDEDEYADNPRGNFEALWKAIDEHYCFFDYKREQYGLDWDKIHDKYSAQIADDMTDTQLFEVLGNMLALLRRYLGTDYRIATGMRYRRLDDNTGYIRCSSFQNGIGAGNLDDILFYLAPCNGLIIDLRDNSGGLLSSAEDSSRWEARWNKAFLLLHQCGRPRRRHWDSTSCI